MQRDYVQILKVKVIILLTCICITLQAPSFILGQYNVPSHKFSPSLSINYTRGTFISLGPALLSFHCWKLFEHVEIMYQNLSELCTTGEGVQYKSTYIHVFKEDMYMYVPQLNTYGYCKLLGHLLLHREVKPGFFVKVTALS